MTLWINTGTKPKSEFRIYFSEREGFEPSVPFRAHTTSNRVPSTTRTSLHERFLCYCFGERGIRTPGTREGSTVFETARFNRSRISPSRNYSIITAFFYVKILRVKHYPHLTNMKIERAVVNIEKAVITTGAYKLK